MNVNITCIYEIIPPHRSYMCDETLMNIKNTRTNQESSCASDKDKIERDAPQQHKCPASTGNPHRVLSQSVSLGGASSSRTVMV